MSEIIVPDMRKLKLQRLDRTVPEQVNRSAWTGGRKIVGQPGIERWDGSVMLRPIATEKQFWAWRAFLFSFESQADWFKLELACVPHIGPKPKIAAGAEKGKTLPLTGMTPNAAIRYAGQFITIPLPSGRFRTVMLKQDLRTDNNGNATAVFNLATYETPQEGVEIETVRPFIPASPTSETLGYSEDAAIKGFQFTFEEAR